MLGSKTKIAFLMLFSVFTFFIFAVGTGVVGASNTPTFGAFDILNEMSVGFFNSALIFITVVGVMAALVFMIPFARKFFGGFMR